MKTNFKTYIFNFILSLIMIALPSSLAIFMAMSGALVIVTTEVFLLSLLTEIVGVNLIKGSYNKKRNLKIKKENELIRQKRTEAVIRYIKEKNNTLERDDIMKNEIIEENTDLNDNIMTREEFEEKYSKLIDNIIVRVQDEKQKEEDYSRVRK